MKWGTKTAIILCFLFLVLPGPSRAKVVGTLGALYPISEPDALEELTSRAAQVQWDRVFNREEAEKKLRLYRPADLKRLPRVVEDRTYQVDVTYTLEFDIPDQYGNVIYPAGLQINPLDYVSLFGLLVFIDASNPDQVAWFRNSGYFNDINVRILITGGSYYELIQDLGLPVFYAGGNIIERMKIRAVPTVVRQKGGFLELKEIMVPEGEGPVGAVQRQIDQQGDHHEGSPSSE